MSRYVPISRAASCCRIAVLVLLFVISVGVQSALGRTLGFGRNAWTNFTNTNEIRGMASRGDTLWLATSGGLVWLVVDEILSPTVLTNAEGLGDNDLSFVVMDQDGVVWTGGLAGQLSRRRADDSWENFTFETEGSVLPLSSAASGPDGFLWVGSSIGIHKFDTRRHGGEIKETYTRLGGWAASDPVSDVLVAESAVWIAGPAGIARADVRDDFLLDYTHWQTWTDLPTINTLAPFGGNVYAGSTDGVWAFTDSLTIPGDTLWERISLPGITVRDLYEAGDTLWIATESGLMFCAVGTCTATPVVGTSRRILTSTVRTSDGSIWGGRASGGVLWYRNGAVNQHVFDGPLSNTFDDIAVGPNGKIWCIHGPLGADYLDGEEWTSLTFVGDVVGPGGPATSVAVDHGSDIWVGTWGGGAFRINPDIPFGDWMRFDTANSSLMWVVDPGGPNNYIVIRDVAVDPSGRVWFANAYADQDRTLPYYDDGCWGWFGISDGFISDDLAELAALDGEVLIGFGNVGLGNLEYNTPLCVNGNPTGSVRRFLYKNSTTDGLPSDDIRAILIDRADSLWVGTNVGLVRWAADIRRFLNVPLPQEAGLMVNALAADALNTVWVGTDRGLVMIPQGGGTEIFTAQNSPLVGNSVQTIDVDEMTGTIWIGTTHGLSRLAAGVAPAETIDDIRAYPNPFEVESGLSRRVRFDAPFDSHIYVFTTSGGAVSDFPSVEGWDGRNNSGALVASGIYIFVVRGPDGDYGRGKIAIIRRR